LIAKGCKYFSLCCSTFFLFRLDLSIKTTLALCAATIHAASVLPAFAGQQEESPMQQAHTKAAEHHESAAKSHRAAAEQHGKNDHTKGQEHSTQAQLHSKTAREHSETAHTKSAQQKK
jgi:hypothetical protein